MRYLDALQRRYFADIAFECNSRAELHIVVGRITADDLWNVMQRDQQRCGQCGDTARLEFDHRVPFWRGGDNTVHNIYLLCRRCHRLKTNAERKGVSFLHRIPRYSFPKGWQLAFPFVDNGDDPRYHPVKSRPTAVSPAPGR